MVAKKPVKPAKKKEGQGRPSRYTHDIAEHICELLSMGYTLRGICRDPKLPEENTVRQWARDNVEGFYAHYVRARDIGLDAMADQILDIADTPQIGKTVTNKASGEEERLADMVEHRKLQVDARKWYLSKMAPKRYDKPETQDDESVAQPVQVVVNVVDASVKRDADQSEA